MSSFRTYGTLEIDETGQSWVLGEVEPHVSIRLKHLFPVVARTATPPYTLRRTDTLDADLSWFISRYPLRAPADLLAELERGRLAFEDTQAELGRIQQPDYRPPALPGFRDGKQMREYQAVACEILRRRRSLLVGDEVGLGKTIVAAGAMLLPEALPAVVVVEPHVQTQWADKIAEFTSLKVHLIKDTKARSLPAADVYLFRYSNVSAWVNVLEQMDIGLACWDEIQRLRKGRETQMGSASGVISHRARYRMGLTATPIYNYAQEIWHVLSFIDPAVLGSYYDYMREWSGEPRALGSYLREQNVFIRRTRKDVARELPPVNKVVQTIDYDAKPLAAIEDIARELAIKATTGEFVERGQAARDLDLRVRHATGVAKARQVAAFARMLLESGEPVLLVGWHRDVYDIWLDELRDHNPVMYTGSESPAGKDRAKQAVLAGESNLLILSLRSGAGLDGLQERFSYVVFGELDWSPGIHHQVIGRLDRDRDGQQRQVQAIFLVVDEGSDPPIMEMLGLKASESTQVVDPALGVQAVASDLTHIQMLARRYLDGRGVAVPAPAAVPAAPVAMLDDPAPAPAKAEQLSLFGTGAGALNRETDV